MPGMLLSVMANATKDTLSDRDLVTAIARADAAAKAAAKVVTDLKAEAARRWDVGSTHTDGHATVKVGAQDRGEFAFAPVFAHIVAAGLDPARYLKVATGEVRKLPEDVVANFPYTPKVTPRISVTK